MTPDFREGKLETQCWICPKCHDDHMGDACTPTINKEFMPVDDDKSYIANEYRQRVVERDAWKDAYEARGLNMAVEIDQLKQQAVEREETNRQVTTALVQAEAEIEKLKEAVKWYKAAHELFSKHAGKGEGV